MVYVNSHSVADDGSHVSPFVVRRKLRVVCAVLYCISVVLCVASVILLFREFR